MNLSGKQVLSIIIAVLSVLMTSTAQLDELLGPDLAKALVSVAGLSNGILAAILTVLGSQGHLVTDVQSMPGVERITVNAQANRTLASLAVDPSNEKIEATPSAKAAVNRTAMA